MTSSFSCAGAEALNATLICVLEAPVDEHCRGSTALVLGRIASAFDPCHVF